MMETFSSTLEGWSVPIDDSGGGDEHCQYAAADTRICLVISAGYLQGELTGGFPYLCSYLTNRTGIRFSVTASCHEREIWKVPSR